MQAVDTDADSLMVVLASCVHVVFALPSPRYTLCASKPLYIGCDGELVSVHIAVRDGHDVPCTYVVEEDVQVNLMRELYDSMRVNVRIMTPGAVHITFSAPTRSSCRPLKAVCISVCVCGICLEDVCVPFSFGRMSGGNVLRVVSFDASYVSDFAVNSAETHLAALVYNDDQMQGLLHVYELPDMRLVSRINTNGDGFGLNHVCFTHDNTLLLSDLQNVLHWTLDGTPLATFETDSSPSCVTVQNDMVAIAVEAGIELWSLSCCKRLNMIDQRLHADFEDPNLLSKLAFTSAQTLLQLSVTGWLREFAVPRGECLLIIDLSICRPSGFHALHDGTLLMFGSRFDVDNDYMRRIHVYSTTNKRVVKALVSAHTHGHVLNNPLRNTNCLKVQGTHCYVMYSDFVKPIRRKRQKRKRSTQKQIMFVYE